MKQRCLIVGRGSIGTRHLALARRLMPDAIIGVLSHRMQPRPDTADHAFFCLADAVAFEPHAAVIANPAPFHLEAARALADSGAHLMVEKPMASESEGLASLIDLCAARKTTLLIAYNLRFSPSLQVFRNIIADQTAGRILSVRAEVGQNLETWRASDYRLSVSARAALGGGVLLELSHELDYLRWIFGDVDWVSAVIGRQSDLDIDVEDTAYLTLGFASLEGGKPLLASLNLDFIRHDGTRTCTAICAEGTLRWDASAGTVTIFRRGSVGWETLFSRPTERDEVYQAEWQHFMDCIAGQKPLIGGDDGLAVVKIIEAAKQSARCRAVVDVT